MKVLKWGVAILIFHPMMIILSIILLFMPFLLVDEAVEVINYEVPSSGGNFVLVGLAALLVYISMKSRFLGYPYRKITVLLPLLQMLIYTSLALSGSIWILNSWADDGSFSKGWAVVLAFLAMIVIRLGMSFLYRKYPLVRNTRPHEQRKREGDGRGTNAI